MAYLTESDVESATLAWLEALGWQIRHGDEIAPDGPAAERPDSPPSSSNPACATPWRASTPTCPPRP